MSDSPSWQAFDSRIAAAAAADLDAVELELFGRKQGLLTMELKKLGAMAPDARKAAGEALNAEKQRLEAAIAARRGELDSAKLSGLAEQDRLDMTLAVPLKGGPGSLHPIPEFIRQVEEVFGRMGFDVADGPEVEDDEVNFSLLNFADDHPARDMHDTFWVSGEADRVLRTHTSNVQIRYMRTRKPPFRMVCPGRVYRKDADATHSPMFHQFEGLMIDKNVSLANMKAVMETAIDELVGRKVELRFRNSYFPFVEPGLEVDMRFGNGRWLEVAGCGMVHQNVLRNCGIDADEWQGFAFGFGVERMLMIRHGIKDLRLFYEGDPRFLAQFR
ncbi:MAG: phenylalanine--tRNA ligase subunit alpha [Candidatus Peribacteraceae bacterium]|nr:phenylalanine--tRNA ligase subunit alpha [Candidatus Peribacteraceae bacterium]